MPDTPALRPGGSTRRLGMASVEQARARMAGPLSSRSRTLYIALATLTVITIVVSLQPSIGLRQLRNLTILASFGVGVALLFADKWARPAAVWAAVGLLSGFLYFGFEAWAKPRARAGEHREGARASSILLGVIAWPLVLPEVIELALTDVGIIGDEPPPP